MTMGQLKLYSEAAHRQRKDDLLEHITAVAAGSRYGEKDLAALVKELKS